MKKRIGVLRGGEGDFYEKSLKEGGDIIFCIHENLAENWKPVDILIDRDGLWHVDGIPLSEKTDLIHKVDVVWNASHPSFSQIFENLNIPYYGMDSFPYALSNNRNMLKEHMKIINVAMPRHMILPVYQPDFDGPRERYSIKKAKQIFEKFGAPWIIKPLDGDPNLAVHIAQTFPELVDAIEDGVSHGKSILVEEFIVGSEAQVHSLSGFRDKDIYTFPFGNFRDDQKERIHLLSREIFKHIGVSHYLKLDFKINKRGKIYFTGIELAPSFKEGSQLVSLSESIGSKKHQILEHILNKAFIT